MGFSPDGVLFLLVAANYVAGRHMAIEGDLTRNENDQQTPPSSPRNGFAVIARGAADLRGVSKDGSRRARGHPSRRAEGGVHLRMAAACGNG
jgi:hypothetical protein